jgi:hypothetical protein
VIQHPAHIHQFEILNAVPETLLTRISWCSVYDRVISDEDAAEKSSQEVASLFAGHFLGRGSSECLFNCASIDTPGKGRNCDVND